MSIIITISLTEEDRKFITDNDLSPSKIMRRAIDKMRESKNKRE